MNLDNNTPKESDLELFRGVDYIELELQGQYKEIKPNETYYWSVLWKTFKVPEIYVIIMSN